MRKEKKAFLHPRHYVGGCRKAENYAYFDYSDISHDDGTIDYRLPVTELPDFIRAWEQSFEADFPDKATGLEWQVHQRETMYNGLIVRCVVTEFGDLAENVIVTRCGPVPVHPVAALYVKTADSQPGEATFFIEEVSTADIVTVLNAAQRLAQTTLPQGVLSVSWDIGAALLVFDGVLVESGRRNPGGKIPFPPDQIEGFVEAVFELMQGTGEVWKK